MTPTGWTGEDARRTAAPGGFAGLLAQVRPDPGEGKTLTEVFGRALRPDKPEVPRDQDEAMANLMARGYQPGQISELARRLADTEGELAAEREKIAKGERNAARVERMRAAGQLSAWDAAQRLDGDFGDAHRAEQLERRAASLRRQLGDASAVVSPQREAPADPLEAATRRARETFQAVTRARLAEIPQASPAPRPFASRGGAGTPDCAECAAAGASRSESAAIHAGEVSRSAAGPQEILLRITSGDGMGQPAAMSGGVIVR
jgi:hypothetical protein